MNILRNPVLFVVFYIVFMIPTYILPYFGSNSAVANAVVEAVGRHLSPLFFVHLFILLFLIFLAWRRGILIGRKWLVLFPVLATIFDLMPALSIIPLVPTAMHLLTIILGVVGITAVAPKDMASA